MNLDEQRMDIMEKILDIIICIEDKILYNFFNCYVLV